LNRKLTVFFLSELLVRSNQLILSKEQAAAQQVTQSGKAIIIATV
jgi:hypothetical protein